VAGSRENRETDNDIRDKLFQAVGFIAELFLNKRATDENINQALEKLGRASDESGLAVYANDPEFSKNGLSYKRYVWKQWSAPSQSSFQIDVFSTKKYELSNWVDALVKGVSIVKYSRELKRDFRKLLEKSEICSLLIVPIFIQNRWWGVITIVNKNPGKIWSATEQDAFKAAANIIGAAIGRKQYETQIIENRRALDTLVSNLPGIAYRCVYNQKRTMEFVSIGAIDLIGYSPKEITGDNVISFSKVIHPKDREALWQKIKEAIGKHESYQLVYRVITAEKKVKWVWEQGCGVFDIDGSVIALEGFILDISERLKMEGELKRNAREIELFNDILAHDIGNINQTVLANLTMLLSEDFGSLNNDQRSLLITFEKQIRRTLALIQKVKTVNLVRGAGTENLSMMDLNTAIRVARDSIISSNKNKIVKINYAPGSDRNVIGDHLIVQLFLNLFENAINNTKGDLARIDVSINSSIYKEMDCWKISICDNGKGIRDQMKEVIFQRFEKGLKRKGSGIGLTIVRALTEKYNGHIYVEDKVKGDYSKGACFQVILPKA